MTTRALHVTFEVSDTLCLQMEHMQTQHKFVYVYI